jgi:hypothetical protein
MFRDSSLRINIQRLSLWLEVILWLVDKVRVLWDYLLIAWHLLLRDNNNHKGFNSNQQGSIKASNNSNHHQHLHQQHHKDLDNQPLKVSINNPLQHSDLYNNNNLDNSEVMLLNQILNK